MGPGVTIVGTRIFFYERLIFSVDMQCVLLFIFKIMESSSTHPQTVEAVASEIIVPSITFYCYEGTLRVNTLCKILITPDVITAQVFPYSFYN